MSLKCKNYHANVIGLILIAPSISGYLSPSIDKYYSNRAIQIVNQSSNKKYISIGTIINGTLTTAIAWTDDFQSSNTRGTIVLNEPLLYSNGDIALPQNSSIVVEVSSWDDKFVTLNAIAVIYESAFEGYTQRFVPENSLTIKNKDNQPLTFENRKAYLIRKNTVVSIHINSSLNIQ